MIVMEGVIFMNKYYETNTKQRIDNNLIHF